MAESRRADVVGTSKAGNNEAIKENASRKATIKNLRKSFISESKFVSKFGNVTDTNLGSFNLKAFMRRIYGQGGNPRTKFSHNIVRSRLYAAAGFQPAVRCPELIMECVNFYNSDHRTIVSPDGMLLANLAPNVSGKAFGILPTDKMLYKSKAKVDKM